jgi:bifunctional UDP-N-acetylglucosamine pyrophosphorylase/glucosamine-1-phosphate N-acetyltransferase
MRTKAILLAAGQGTRMHSTLPKVLHPLLGRPLILYGLETARIVTQAEPVVVLGHEAERIRPVLGESAQLVFQEPQLGTAHAVQQAETLLRAQADLILVMAADMPLITSQTLTELVDCQLTNPGPLTLLSLNAPNPRGFGRVIRDSSGHVRAIVEEAAANTQQLTIHELNTSIYCIRADWLWQALPRVPISMKGEYYLTDLVGIAVSEGLNVQALVLDDPNEGIGINNRIHLAEAEAILRKRINEAWMLSGVTLIDPATTYIEPGVRVGQDTVIFPNTFLQGNTEIGERCTLGPNTIVRSSQIGSECKIFASVIEEALLEEHVDIGPFGHLRKGAHLARGVHLGNFGEVKNSYLAPGTKMGHFSYIGDATIGPAVNIGAGTITCNFSLDGKKNKTEIGEGAFIGSDTLLIAPVKVGAGAATGSGAVVTKDVPAHTLAVGMPARAIKKLKPVA